MKLIIAGSRDLDSGGLEMIRMAIVCSCFEMHKVNHIVTGDCRGVDTAARYFAKCYHIPLTVYWANWEEHGRKAGPIRNEQMAAESGADGLIAIPGPNSRGTYDMIRRAEKRGLKVYVHEVDHG